MKVFQVAILALSIVSTNIMADEYVIDKKGMHASIQFKIAHLGYSWLWGRFNDFDGEFTYDKSNPNASKIEVTINTKSVDSNHAERDKHLRSDEFLDVEKFPQSKFVSTSFMLNEDGTGELKGNFTLHGVTKPITIAVKYIGEGDDPWGGYRVGFEGTTRIALADYGILKNLGPASKELDLILSIEGVRK
ncbi:MAG: YceI family protein [Proteobacteria bacterium]|nr:YceI family protein [Pseudomonadota bacterium]NOG60374.1 YceI family protein [Pseudomonadota bacterium]